MNIKFEKISMHNFLSFENAELQLNDNGFTLVKGVNLNVDDNALSNGSGKSSIWEAITWALTGETIRGAKDVKRLGSDDTCSVTIIFTIDNITYEITRTKDPSNLKLIVNGEDKSGKGIRDTQQILAQYLPDLTSSLIGSVIILGQGLPQRFTNNSPSGRKDVLEKLSKSDFMIEDLKQRITNRKTVLSQKQREFEDAILVSNTKKRVSETNKLQAEAKRTALLNTNTEDILTTINTLTSMRQELEDNIVSLTEEANKLKEELDNFAKNIYKLRAEVAEKKNVIQQEFNEEITPMREFKAGLKTRINTLRQQIQQIKAIKDVCPTCGQKLPNVVKPTSEKEEAELINVEKLLSDTEERDKELTDIYNKKLNDVTMENSVAIKEEEAKSKELTAKSNSVQAELTSNKQKVQTTLTQIATLEKSIADLDKELSLSEAIIEKSSEEIVNYDNEILYNTGEKEIISNHLDVINKMGNVITRDFRGYLLTNVIDYINKQSKSYAKDIFETDKINFALNGNNISIGYCDKEYESLSGGEKQKVDLIVQFAIRDMLCNFLDFSCNILVLDEIADNIDSVGAEKLFSTIATKINDVESIFIISHHQDFDMPVDREIKIIKGEDGISRVE